jgi:predicted GTPase
MTPIIQINRVNWDLNKMSKHHTKHNSLNNRNFHQEEEIGEFKKILSRNQSNNQSNNQFNKQFNNLNRMKLQQIIGG